MTPLASAGIRRCRAEQHPSELIESLVHHSLGIKTKGIQLLTILKLFVKMSRLLEVWIHFLEGAVITLHMHACAIVDACIALVYSLT